MMKTIPLSVPNFEGNEKKYVDNAIDEAWVSTAGGYVSALEKNLADYLKTSAVVACQSGTSALHLSFIEAGIAPGDTVIVPPLTFIAAVNPVKYRSAVPVFIDCDDSLCLDPLKLKEFCREECSFENGILKYKNSQVKAVVVVHVFGNLADMEAINAIAEEYNLKVIEDATEALGSYFTEGKYKGKYAGTVGDFGCFSFNGNKIITTGGGGAVTAKDDFAIKHIKYLSTQAKDDPLFYVHNEVGYNYRMTNLQAALGVAQLECLPEFIRRKHNNYDLYKKSLADCNLCCLLPFRDNTYPNKWFYSLKIQTDKLSISLKEIIEKLAEDGIQTRPVWGLINEQKPYRNEYTYRLEKAVYYAGRILNIPCSTNITKADIEYVSEHIKSLLRRYANE